MSRRDSLTTPRQTRVFEVHYDNEAFGRFSESIARTLGTARFLVAQTVIHITFLLSAMAIAASDRLMPQPPKPHGKDSSGHA